MDVMRVDCVVIGAGVIGLAIARALAQGGREVWCLEREDAYGMITSSRNSEVIHAGIYYPQGSLKARHCVRGKEWLYAYCEQYRIPHRRCGKLIVASNAEQVEQLVGIRARAMHNGVNDLTFLDAKDIRAIEPELAVAGGLMSPSTGIIDSHAYMTQLVADLEAAGGHLVCRTPVAMDSVRSQRIRLRLLSDDSLLETACCINAAGLDAPALLRGVEGFDASHIPQTWFAKGSYFSYQGKTPFSHLIYPVPVDGGLGVHLTLDMQGSARFGPDVDWLEGGHETCDLQVPAEKSVAFAQAVKAYWPALDTSRLAPDYAGVRPKLSGPGAPAADFVVQGSSVHGVDGLVNVFGIESPGLTASLSLAQEVVEVLENASE